MKLTVLVDNNTYIDQYYCGEPAVSYYIEDGEKRILFDTGYSNVFLRNAEKMGIDLQRVTHVVLSHGHNDHTGGLEPLVRELDVSDMELIAHPNCFLPKRAEGLAVGAPFSREIFAEKLKLRLQKTPYRLSERLTFLGEIPRANDFEGIPVGEQLEGGIWTPDRLLDDTALVYRAKRGLFVITGCSHSGICNIVEYAKQVCGEQRILGILGGFHLFADDERLKKTVDYLASCGVEQMYPCHCVSLIAKARMLEKLPVHEVGVGLGLTVE